MIVNTIKLKNNGKIMLIGLSLFYSDACRFIFRILTHIKIFLSYIYALILPMKCFNVYFSQIYLKIIINKRLGPISRCNLCACKKHIQISENKII